MSWEVFLSMAYWIFYLLPWTNVKNSFQLKKKIQNEKQKAVGAYSVSEIIFFIDVKPKIWTLGAPH